MERGLGRTLAVVVLIAGAWLFGGTVRAEARPTQDMVEYGGVASKGAGATKDYARAPGANEPGFQPSDVIDPMKENKPVVIVVVGAVMLMGLWKVVT
ncbi:MAG: hypothetical protein ABIP03_03355 [Aquihabitans sp.]